MFNTRQLSVWFCFIFILLGGVGSYLQLYLQTKSNHHKQDDKFDYVMENVTVLHFNKEGKLASKMTAPTLVHFLKNDTAFLVNPLLLLTQSFANPWTVRADQGKVENNAERIFLHKNVYLHRPGSAQQADTTLLTETLEIWPKKQLAETKAPVTVAQPGVTVKSIGMRADLLNNQVKLLSQVQENYVRN